MKRSFIFSLAMMVTVLVTGCTSGDPRGFVQPSGTFKEAEGLFLRGQYAEARQKFQAVLGSRTLNDQKWQLEARYYIARCAHLSGDLSEAVRIYNSLLKAPRYKRLEARLHAARADINLETGNYKGAAYDYNRARWILEKHAHLFGGTQDPVVLDREKLLFGEGMALWSMRKLKESDEVFDLYMADFPRGRFIKEAKAHHTKFTGTPLTTKFYCLVGGLYRVDTQARQLARQLRLKGFTSAEVDKEPSGRSFLYKVKVGALDSRQEAYALKKQLQSAGFRSVQVRP